MSKQQCMLESLSPTVPSNPGLMSLWRFPNESLTSLSSFHYWENQVVLCWGWGQILDYETNKVTVKGDGPQPFFPAKMNRTYPIVSEWFACTSPKESSENQKEFENGVWGVSGIVINSSFLPLTWVSVPQVNFRFLGGGQLDLLRPGERRTC